MIQLIINGIEVTPYAEWTGSKIKVQRADDFMRISVTIENITLIDSAYIQVSQLFPDKIPIKLILFGFQFEGWIYPGDIVWYPEQKRVKVKVTFDNTTDFEDRIVGTLLDKQLLENQYIVVSPKENWQGVILLGITGAFLYYTMIKETLDILTTLTTLSAVSSTGIGAPGAAIATVIIMAARIIFIANLIKMLQDLIKEIYENIEKIISTYTVNIGKAISYICNKYGLTVSYDINLNKIWIISPNIDLLTEFDIFDIARKLTNSYIWISGYHVKFISNNAVVSNNLDIAYYEGYKISYDEVPNRKVIKFIHDIGDDYTTLMEHTIECIFSTKFKGLREINLEYSPVYVSSPSDLLINKLMVFNTLLGQIAQFFNAAVPNYVYKINKLKVERGIYNKKLYWAEDKDKISIIQHKYLTEFIKNNYNSITVCKIVEEKIPMNINTFSQLWVDGFPGIEELEWYPIGKFATVRMRILYENVNAQVVNIL